ncbi:MAG: hypothetical protein U0L11_04720 [Acutalibacteraceae bacterium]|nr:hypothetical protein [Acutalibacteraceae bacterium]
MKTKALNFFSAVKYQLILFVLMAGQAIITMFQSEGVGPHLSIYYLVDLSMIKASRTWVGTLASILTDHPTQEWISKFAVVIVFLMIFIVSVAAGKVIKNVEKEIKPQIFVVALFLITGTFTFYPFYRYLGMVDIHMCIIAVVSLVFLNNKILRWLVPVLCAAGFFVHQVFVITYFPLIVFAALYIMLCTKGGKVLKSALFLSVFGVTLAVFVWGVLYGTDTNIFATPEEMIKAVEEKGKITLSEGALINLNMQYFYAPPEEVGLTAEQVNNMSLWELFLGWARYTNVIRAFSPNDILSIFSFVTVVCGFFWAIWIKSMKNTDSKSKRFVFFCFMMSVLGAPLSCIIAPDYIRWCQAIILVQFGFVFFMFSVKDEAFEKTMVQAGEFFKNKKILLVIAFFVYIMTVQMDLG